MQNLPQALRVSVLSLVLSLAGGIAQGAVILVDHSDVGTDPTLGGTWNATPSNASNNGPGLIGSPIALVDSSGAPTGVTLTYGGSFASFPSPYSAWSFGDLDWVDGDVTTDIFGASSAVTFTFSGLTPGALYQLDHLAVRSTAGSNRVGNYTVSGSFGDSTPNGSSFDGHVDGFLGGNILSWTVAADGAGTITLTGSPISTNSFTYHAATRLMDVSAVPEPGTLVLLALPVIGMLVRRRTSA